MKKTISALLITALLLSLCSCGLTVTQIENGEEVTQKYVAQTSVTPAAEEVTTEEETTVGESIIEAVTRQIIASALSETVTNKEEKTQIAKTRAERTTSEKTTRKRNFKAPTQPQTTEASTAGGEYTYIAVAPTTRQAPQPATKPTAKTVTCTVRISCESILNNKNSLRQEKEEFVPNGGEILNSTEVTLPEGSTAFDALKYACENNSCSEKCRYCEKNGIHLDYIYTPGYDSYYVRGIHQIYEKDCGSQSGWMFSVNGEYPNYASSQYKLKNGDAVTFSYTCDLGNDVGADN